LISGEKEIYLAFILNGKDMGSEESNERVSLEVKDSEESKKE